MATLRHQFNDQGYLILKDLVDKHTIDLVMGEIGEVYQRQFDYLGIDEGDFEKDLVALFQRDLCRYTNASRTVHLTWNLAMLACSEQVRDALVSVGLQHPVTCQKPVINMNCRTLATAKEYYIFPPHQDYRAMQGSLNSVVVGFPLVDATKELGALQVVPGSHKEGLMMTAEKPKEGQRPLNHVESLRALAIAADDRQWVDLEMDRGSCFVMSSFLLHRSGVNVTDRVRWTALLRYNDLSDPYYIETGFRNPNKYARENYIDETFDYKSRLERIYS